MTIPTVTALAALLIGTLSITSSWRSERGGGAPEVAIPHNSDFNKFLPETRASYAEELRQHTDRLQRIEGLLRARDVSDLPAALRTERERTIGYLHDYWVRAEYPTAPAIDGPRRPCFIDAAGRVCAVGYLIERSVGRDEAERINARWNPNTIREINDPALAAWIANSGLSYDEVVAIQRPMLNAPPSTIQPVFSQRDREQKLHAPTVVSAAHTSSIGEVGNVQLSGSTQPAVRDTGAIAQRALPQATPSTRAMRD